LLILTGEDNLRLDWSQVTSLFFEGRQKRADRSERKWYS